MSEQYKECYRQLQHTLFPSDIIEKESFPLVCDEMISHMQMVYVHTKEDARCFAFLRFLEDKPYVDLYIWDIGRFQSKEEDAMYSRFVICEGKIFSLEDEELFDYYCMSGMSVDEQCRAVIMAACVRYFDTIHMREYERPQDMLMHLYYSLHRSGPREILYKSNLQCLARVVGKIDVNWIGSTPSAIFNGICLSFLRKINTKQGVDLLEQCNDVALFNHVAQCVDRDHISFTKYQCRYLLEVSQGVFEDGFEKDVFEFIEEIRYETEYHRYCRYLRDVKAIADYYTMPIIPEMDDEGEYIEFYEQAHILCYYVEKEHLVDGAMQQIYESHSERFCYKGEQYSMLLPSGLRQFLYNAKKQRNCLWEYVSKHLRGESIIVYLRKNDSLDEPLATAEIKKIRDDYAIMQAYAACNQHLSPQQENFLYEYADKANLKVLTSSV